MKSKVRRVEYLLVAQLNHQPIRHELYILDHQRGVHADHSAGDGVGDELLLNLHASLIIS
jgi:hypothetical protein